MVFKLIKCGGASLVCSLKASLVGIGVNDVNSILVSVISLYCWLSYVGRIIDIFSSILFPLALDCVRSLE